MIPFMLHSLVDIFHRCVVGNEQQFQNAIIVSTDPRDDLYDDLQHIVTEWTKMFGFLCSLGVVATGDCTVRSVSTVPSVSSVESLTNLAIYSNTR